jgi:hypothetical protein
MIGLTLAMLAIVFFVILAGGVALLMLVKAVLWLVLLPVRIIVGLLFGLFVLPFVLLKFLVLGVVAIVVAPILVLAAAAALIAAVAGVVIPLFPLLCIGFVVWVVMRSQRAATA